MYNGTTTTQSMNKEQRGDCGGLGSRSLAVDSLGTLLFLLFTFCFDGKWKCAVG